VRVQVKRFMCDKHLVLGALYDVVEKLHWTLISANSEEGILIVAERVTKMLFLIRVNREEAGHTEITMELASGTFDGVQPEKEASCLLDMLTQIIDNALNYKKIN